MGRRILTLLLMLLLPLANASAAVMGMPGYGCTSSPAAQAAEAAGDCSHHSAREASAHHGPAGDHAAQDAHCPDHASPEGSSSHAGCGHCDFCLAALGAPNADPAHQGGLVTNDRPAGRASALTSAFLETPRRPPSR